MYMAYMFRIPAAVLICVLWLLRWLGGGCIFHLMRSSSRLMSAVVVGRGSDGWRLAWFGMFAFKRHSPIQFCSKTSDPGAPDEGHTRYRARASGILNSDRLVLLYLNR